MIGGGEIAARKVNGLLDAGASIIVIGPDICEAIEESARGGRVKIVRRKYRKGDLKGMALVIVAIDDAALNRRVAADARASGVPVNVADDPDECDFTIPAVMRRGDITVAIGTGGASPALAREMKKVIEKVIGPEYAELTRILGELRRTFLERGEKLSERRALFEALIGSGLKDCLKRRDFKAAKKIVTDLAGEDVEISREGGR